MFFKKCSKMHNFCAQEIPYNRSKPTPHNQKTQKTQKLQKNTKLPPQPTNMLFWPHIWILREKWYPKVPSAPFSVHWDPSPRPINKLHYRHNIFKFKPSKNWKLQQKPLHLLRGYLSTNIFGPFLDENPNIFLHLSCQICIFVCIRRKIAPGMCSKCDENAPQK